VSPGLPYLVVRCHSLLGRLLTPSDMRRLAEAGDIEGFLRLLSHTPYGEIALEEGVDPSISLERALNYKLLGRVEEVLRAAPGRMGAFLEVFTLMRLEVINLKRILRGRFTGLPPSSIMASLIPMQPYGVADYGELAEAGDVVEVVSRLRGTPYEALEEVLDLLRLFDALWPLELRLSHLYFSEVSREAEVLPSVARSLARRLIGVEVDVENLLAAIKLRAVEKRGEVLRRIGEIFTSTYLIEHGLIKRVIEAEALQPLIRGLDHPYDWILEPLLEDDMAMIRARLRRYIRTLAMDGRRVDDYGMSVALSYIMLNELEKDDLVSIGWGLIQGIPMEDVTRYLTHSL